MLTILILALAAAAAARDQFQAPNLADVVAREQFSYVPLVTVSQSEVRFKAHGVNVVLKLRPASHLFTPDLTLETWEGGVATQKTLDTSGFREGFVNGDETARTHVYVDPVGGTVRATLTLANVRYHLHPARQYADLGGHAAAAGLHVLFRADSVRLPPALQNASLCGASAVQERLATLAAARRPAGAATARRDAPFRSSNVAACKSCTCPLALVADQKAFAGPHCQGNEATCAVYMVNTLQAANDMYQVTNFSGRLLMGFSVKKIIIYKDSGAGNPVPGDSYTADTFLDAFSKNGNWGAYCLAHVFTHREFDGGILGLAWVGSVGGSGGVCDTGNLNTGMTTSLNFGATVADVVSQITVSHEIGHNWGSPHDTSAECAPGSGNGNYIMFPYATDGSQRNNKLFSSCSIASMSTVLSARQSKCFDDSRYVCGNGIVEPANGEDCDCGGDSCSPNDCCGADCKVRPQHECSPQDSIRFPCCDATCKNITAAAKVQCQAGSDCAEASQCNGLTAQCPPPVTKPDFVTPCACKNNDCVANPLTAAKSCMRGVCNVSFCEMFEASPCVLSGAAACQLACNGVGWGKNSSQCVSTFDAVCPGTTCQNFQGYCDAYGECVTVDSQSVLDKLEELLNPTAIINWIKGHWIYLVGAAAGVVVLVGLLKVTYRKRKVARGGYHAFDEELPLANKHARAQDNDNMGWYHPQLTRADAEVLLGNARLDGAFLVWDNNGKNRPVLSVFFRGKVQHLAMLVDNDGVFFQSKPTQRFMSMAAMVHQLSSGYPRRRGLLGG